ncbi:MAG: hypothetical protein P9G45_07275, partial [Candidatus Contendobacter sp.]|nr:hypothetical protein [Candidatus Contendobacter sp.]
MRETPVSPKPDRTLPAFADHLDLMFGTRERVIKTPDNTQDHVEVSRHFDGDRRYFRKRFLRSQKSGVDYRAWTNREFTLLNELKSRRLRHVQEYRSIADLGPDGQQLETWDAGPDGDQWQQAPVARDGHRLPHLFLECGHWFGLARWLLAALEEVHALGFVHVDLKGDNFCLPAHGDGVAVDGHPERVRLRWGELRLIDFAFSVWENRVPLPANMPLPIGENDQFRYQSGQLRAALRAGNSPPFDLGLTQRLDWRADLYSLGFTLNQILAEVERRCFPEDGNWGWTGERHARARRLVGDLRGWDERWKQHGQPTPVERPHGALIALLDRVLGEDDLAASLARDWRIVRDPNWRPQDASVRTPPTAPAPKRRDEAQPPTSTPLVGQPPTGKRSGRWTLLAIASVCVIGGALGIPALYSKFERTLAEQATVKREQAQRQQEIEQAKAEAERLAQAKAEAEKLAQAKAKAEKLAQAKAEAERLAQAKAEAEKLAQAKAEAEKLAQAKAEAYGDGRGVPKDNAEAVMWYKAAEQGDADAQFNLGVMYDNGQGVRKDEAEAVKWYRKAAEQGNADAQNNLGWMYTNGQGVRKDEAEAVKWYR